MEEQKNTGGSIAFADDVPMTGHFYVEVRRGDTLVEVIDDAPRVSRIAGRHGAQIGAFTMAPGNGRVVVVATLDNLLKGAATQAMQNLNLALGFDELTSIQS